MRPVAAALVTVAVCAAVPAFAQELTPQWCAENRDQNITTRSLCADASWCKTHWNDDRISRIACDPFRSKADVGLPMPQMSRAALDMGRMLSREETISLCFAGAGCDINPPHLLGTKPVVDEDETMLPPGVTAARLALRGDIEFGTAGVMHVRIALVNGREGVLWINGEDYGYRQTRLSPAEISTLMDALNRSQFWRLPVQGGHMGAADGMMASIEISVPGRQHHVTDMVGQRGAMDLSVLANAITPIVFAHWKGI
jgi:hypothetical protein